MNRLVHIKWEGPLGIEQLGKRWTERPHEKGLYQIYGRHPVYGRQVLLYIGQTRTQSFYRRNRQKGEILFFQYLEELRFHVGLITTGPAVDWEKGDDIVDQCESLLIYVHQPAGNSSKIQTLDNSVEGLTIYNWNSHGDLLPEVSYDRWSDKYWVNENWMGEEIR